MTPRKRKIYFWIATTVFALGTPLLILYSSGWRVDFQILALVKTGGIFINTFPKGVKVYIDGKIEKEKAWVKTYLRKEVVFLLKNYQSVLK